MRLCPVFADPVTNFLLIISFFLYFFNKMAIILLVIDIDTSGFIRFLKSVLNSLSGDI